MNQPRTSFSVIVPTFGRAGHVRRLLASLQTARIHYDGKAEVIVVDSSDEGDAKQIRGFCSAYGASYYPGEQSVRWKRNFGASRAVYPVVLFLDSDCEADAAIFQEHARVFETGIENLGGVYGLTKFSGERSFLWKVIERTPFVDAFSFAERVPYVQWGIGNNISFRKEIFDELGGFEEGFPFRLGGDDLEFSLRMTAAGYLIRTNPRAVACHARDTWNSWPAMVERAVRWGRMEYHLGQKFPALLRRDLPGTWTVFLVLLVLALITAGFSGSTQPLWGALVWIVSSSILARAFARNTKGEGTAWLPGLLAALLVGLYQLGRAFEFLRNGRVGGLFRRMIYSPHHVQAIWPDQAGRQWAAFTALAIAGIFLFLR